jgi:hypothetical protein
MHVCRASMVHLTSDSPAGSSKQAEVRGEEGGARSNPEHCLRDQPDEGRG